MATAAPPKLPDAAKRLIAAPIKLEAVGPKASAEGASALPAARLKLVCRTDEAVDLWSGLKLVHDLSSFEALDETPCDYCHDHGDIIGRCSNYRLEQNAIVCDADIEAIAEGDTADNLIKRMDSKRAPVPYQSSVEWYLTSTGSVQFLEQGTEQVNGQSIAAPALIVRGWTIREMAICPLGADSSTSAELLKRLSAETIAAGEPTADSEAKPKEEAKPEAKPDQPSQEEGEEKPAAAPTTPPTVADSEAKLSLSELKRFSAKFGADALGYIEQGLDYPTALEKHLEKTAGELTASRAKVSELETKLAKPANVPNRGEADALSAGHSGGKPNADRYAHLGRLAAFATRHDPNREPSRN